MNLWAPESIVRSSADPFKIAPRLNVLIKDLTIQGQVPNNAAYRATFQRLEWLIAGLIGCENDAKSIKTIVSLLFSGVVNNEGNKPDPSPRTVAMVAGDILGIIPDTICDWTRPADATNRGKLLFRQLILERARAHLQAPAVSRRDGRGTWRPDARFTIDTKSDKPILITMLNHSGKVQLSEFIGELVARKLLPTILVQEYVLKLIHSTSVPTPTRSELEAACRLLRLTDTIIRSLHWAGSIYYALELTRKRAGMNLEGPLRVLLLVSRL